MRQAIGIEMSEPYQHLEGYFAGKIASIRPVLSRRSLFHEVGRVTAIGDLYLETDLAGLAVSDVCEIGSPQGPAMLQAQVVSVEKNRTVLAPFGSVHGLTIGSIVRPTGGAVSIPVGDFLIGSTIDGFGNPLDEDEEDEEHLFAGRRPVLEKYHNPLNREMISDILSTGICSIDGMLTVGRGQRMAILGEAGAGKSSLLAMLASNTEADVVVIGMVGERGRELRDFLERQLPPEVRARCVVVTATSDRPALERINAGHVASTVAEYFRDQGKDVLLLFDSITRFARAQREVGLAAGEQAVRGGLTPSVYANLPRLIERSGNMNNGSITAFYTVLTENEGINDPLAEEVMSLTDGHILLDGKLAQKGHYPAISILRSKSRLMNELILEDHAEAASRVRAMMAKYEDIELLVQVGEYQAGNDWDADAAIKARPAIEQLLKQSAGTATEFGETVFRLRELATSTLEHSENA